MRTIATSMRWHVLLEIAVGLAPSTLAYLASLPIFIGTFIGSVLSLAMGVHGADVAAWVFSWTGSMLLSGVFALPPLWTLSIDRLHGRLSDSDMAWMRICLATGCTLAAIHLALTWMTPGAVIWVHAYLVAAPLALAAREVLARRGYAVGAGSSAAAST